MQANAIDLTILQALTGLRVGEATAITWPMVEFTDDGEMVLDRSPAIVKTRDGPTPRCCPAHCRDYESPRTTPEVRTFGTYNSPTKSYF